MKSEDEKPENRKVGKSLFFTSLWATALSTVIIAIPLGAMLLYRSGTDIGSFFQNDIVVFATVLSSFAGVAYTIIRRIDKHTENVQASTEAHRQEVAKDRRKQQDSLDAHRKEVATDRRKQQASLDAHRKEHQASLDAHRKEVATDRRKQQESLDAHQRETARDRRKQQHTLDAHQRQHQKLMQEFKKEMSRFGERQSHLEGKSQS